MSYLFSSLANPSSHLCPLSWRQRARVRNASPPLRTTHGLRNLATTPIRLSVHSVSISPIADRPSYLQLTYGGYLSSNYSVTIYLIRGPKFLLRCFAMTRAPATFLVNRHVLSFVFPYQYTSKSNVLHSSFCLMIVARWVTKHTSRSSPPPYSGISRINCPALVPY